MSNASAWMPLYVGDYLGDTQRLTTEQHGAYLLLMLDYWRNGPPPDDDAVLQQITKLDKSAWKKHRPILSRMFQIESGAWNHKRIDRELNDARENAQRRSEKAKAGAKARWGHSPKDAPSNAPSIEQALPIECAPPSPSPKIEPQDKSCGGAQRASRLPNDFVVPSDWRAWAVTDSPLNPSQVDREAETFVDYWRSKSGRDATKLDWQATWRNWIRNSRSQPEPVKPRIGI